MAMQSLPLAELYYETGSQNTFAIPIELSQDEILKIADSTSTFIPLQQSKATQVIITTSDSPENAGNFDVLRNNEPLEGLSYNHGRSESLLQYHEPEAWEGARYYEDVVAMFDSISEENSINSFWKWFVIFAVVFLVLELLVLKFFKN
jgi:nicotinamidase-related amidase